MMLELQHIRSIWVTVHLDVKLMRSGSPGTYVAPSNARNNSDGNLFTPIGDELAQALSRLSGIHVMYGQYDMIVQVPPVLDFRDVIWDIQQQIAAVLSDDILFTTTLGDDAFERPPFIENPDRQTFIENINGALAELRQRSQRAS